MKIELSHDAIARLIYEKASTDDKMRIKVASFIRNRHAYYLENRILLKNDDLNYIYPHLSNIELSEEESTFIKASRKQVQFRRLVYTGTILLAFVALASLYASAQRGKNNLERMFVEIRRAKEAIDKSYELQDLSDAELKRLAAELRILNDSLAAQSQILERKSDSLRLAVEQLEDANKLLTNKANEEKKRADAAVTEANKFKDEYTKLRTNRVQVPPTAASLNTNTLQSSLLSSRSLHAYNSNDKKLAFQLARLAWELNNNNREAAGVLNWIANPPGAFNKKPIWAAKYDPKQIKSIIDKLHSAYGELSSTDKKNYLQ